ncbi:MarR family transcriptional regulator [Streptomyces sp. NBC_00102]|uniref:MarR family transcriptional regulator n=1 Tax=Streptomyces sp. NBC_00102 TaxID=2975652 RepID=UPI0022591EBE|nr:MarR family transcriptional regulator [Streptomyces sp. NBC_00102]MCX5399508.1 MarR family transcriptional regulator [Streptomyces sp. NBC_00102]
MPAASRPYRRANNGYGKQSVQPASGQASPGAGDFAFLPERERYVAAYVDHLPEGAAMDIKSLAKDLPLYGQMAIGTALRALGVAGHLRRVRRQVEGEGACRWVTLTFWSRTAHDNEWWTARLESAAAASEQPGAPSVEPCPTTGPDPVVPRQRTAESAPGRSSAPDQPSEAVSAADPGPDRPVPPASPTFPAPCSAPVVAAPAAPPVPEALPATGAPAAVAGPSPAYVALAELGRREPRLTLSAADCEVLEPLAAAWFARGVSAGYLTSALTAGLPEQVGSPVGLVRRRLTDKMPPRMSATPTPPPPPAPGAPAAPVRGLLVECTDCGRPARAEALPDGLCAPCRTAH